MKIEHSEKLVAWALRIGAYGSAALLLIGVALTMAGSSDIGVRVETWGILFLLATPIVRIIAAMAMFALQDERRMVLVSAGVLLIIVLSSWAGMQLG
jgi:uncharacterized membrane protein